MQFYLANMFLERLKSTQNSVRFVPGYRTCLLWESGTGTVMKNFFSISTTTKEHCININILKGLSLAMDFTFEDMHGQF